MTSEPASIARHVLLDGDVHVYLGDCLDVLATLDADSIDSVVTDPPYGIAFMGKAWDQPGEFGSARRDGTPGVQRPGLGRNRRPDTSAMEFGRYDLSSSALRNFQRWCEAWSAECLRVLKPGGHLLAFGGSRTWHRLAAGIEDAGFEVRDSIAWLYGSGFPKSLDVGKAIDDAAGAAREPSGAPTSLACEYVRRGEPCQGHDGETATSQSGLTIHALPTTPVTEAAKQWDGWGTALKPSFEPIVVARKPFRGTVADNVTTHGTGALNIDACRVAHRNGADLAESMGKKRHADFGSGARNNSVYRPEAGTRADQGNYDGAAGRWPSNAVLDHTAADELDRQSGRTVSRRSELTSTPGDIYGMGKGLPSHTGVYGFDDEGGASRFFPVFRYAAKASTAERPSADGIVHPTVKPLDLMRWLVRLVTPPHGHVLDPFAGSGTTAEAAVHEHMRCTTIERESAYVPLIVARLSKPLHVGFDFDA